MPGGRYRWEWVGPVPLPIRLSFLALLVHLVPWAVAIDNTRRCADPAALCASPWLRMWAQSGLWIELGLVFLVVALTIANRSKLKQVP